MARNHPTRLQVQQQILTQTKLCSTCGILKHFSAFHRDKRCKNGLVARCKACKIISSQAYYKDHSQIIRHRARQYALEHAFQTRTCFRLRMARRRARVRNLPDTFTLEDEAFCLRYWNYACAVCGRENGLWYTIVLDHWQPIKSLLCPGTIPQNMIPLCHGRKGKPEDMEKCCNQTKQAKDPGAWLIEKLGPYKAKNKLREITTYFQKVVIR